MSENNAILTEDNIINPKNINLEERTRLLDENKKLKNIIEQNGKIISILQHDIRSPLACIQYLSLMISEEYDSLMKQHPELDLTATNIPEFQKSLLEYSEATINIFEKYNSWIANNKNGFNLKCNDYNINDLIKEAHTDLKLKLDSKQIKLNLIANAAENLIVHTDKSQIYIILNNLISNSIKFTPSGKNIYVHAEPFEQNYVKVTVHDEGQGIPAELKDKLFSIEGITSDGTNGEKGTGKGLMFCRELVEKQGGKIWIDQNTDYSGAKIHFTIPKYSQNEMLIKSSMLESTTKKSSF